MGAKLAARRRRRRRPAPATLRLGDIPAVEPVCWAVTAESRGIRGEPLRVLLEECPDPVVAARVARMAALAGRAAVLVERWEALGDGRCGVSEVVAEG